MDFIKVKTKKSQKTKQNPTPPHSPWQTFSNSFLSVFIETYPPTLLTTWKHTSSSHLPRKKKKASRYNKHEFTWTNSHTAMNKVDKSRTPFSSTPLWQGVYTWSTDMENTQQEFLDPFCPAPWRATSSPRRCQAAFSSCHSKPDTNKNASPKLLPRQLKVRQQSTAVQRSPSQGAYSHTPEHVTVWEDKTCLCASRSRSLYFFQKHQRPHSRVADKKEVKLLKNWTSRLGVESAVKGLKWKKHHYSSQQHCSGFQASATANLNVWLPGLHLFHNANKCVAVRLWLQCVCCASHCDDGKAGKNFEKQKGRDVKTNSKWRGHREMFS